MKHAFVSTALMLAVTLVSLVGCSERVGSVSVPLPKIEKIDAEPFVAGLPLVARETLLSGNGRKKTLWQIEGASHGSFEIIGNDQHDADQVGWQCHVFNAEGNIVPPAARDHFCHRFFVTVLSRLTDDAEELADGLIGTALRTGTTADATIGDFSVDTMDGFYFVRRISRYDRSR